MFNIINPNSLVDDEELEYGERCLSLEKIQNIADNKQKKDLPAVVISDYTMPGMNGIEFFEAIADMPVMKILLTGNADLDLALHAFNRSIVNKFLVKNSSKVLNDVEEAIIACQHGFFQKQSYPIINGLGLSEDSLLNKINVLKDIEHIIHEKEIVEYYLIDTIGSYLLITKTGKKIYFICMTDRQFIEYEDIAITSRASVEIINQLKKRTHAPVFISKEAYKLQPKDWKNILHRFEKKNEYYFCVVEK